ncbi:MAG: STAS domain-containing protein [Bacteroidetes bacterium]|nr:STAS domain-containing protein [Bacteroidota bacterium]
MSTFREDGHQLTCVLDERLDTLLSRSFEEELEGKPLDRYTDLIFDMEKVQYVSSSFLRICIKTAKQLQPGRLSIIHVSPVILKILNIANITGICRVE